MNLPNLITTLRFFLIPIYIWTFFTPLVEKNLLVSTGVFLVAGITDVLDGHIARKYNMVTKYGTALDPLADKLMQTTVLICLAAADHIPLFLPVVLIIKEILMIMGGLFLYFKGKKTVIPSNKYGKLSTLVFYLTVFIIALKISTILNYAFIALTFILMLLSFFMYFRDFRKVQSEIS